MKVYKVIQMILPIVGSCFLPTLYAVDASELSLHSPIYIKGNDGFTMENGVISGNGTQENPYIIENLKIRANLRNDGIRIEDTDKYFVIRNCYIFYLDGILAMRLNRGKSPYFQNENKKPYPIGIFLDNVSHGLIENCTIRGTYQAICLNRSSYIIIKDCYVYENLCGIGIKSGSHHNKILRCRTFNYACGVCLYQNASNNTVIACSSIPLRSLRGLRVSWTGYYVHDSNYNKEINCEAFCPGKTFINLKDKGMWIRNATNNLIKGFLCYGLPRGVVVEKASNNVILNSKCFNNFIGFYVGLRTEGNLFSGNLFIGNWIDTLDFSRRNLWYDNYKKVTSPDVVFLTLCISD